MTLQEAIETIQSHLRRMNDLYGQPVFDEWALVALFDRKARILHYVGPRREDLHSRFVEDTRHFLNDLLDIETPIGHFDFSRDAEGSRFDAYLMVGDGCFLICNHTSESMASIAKDPRWLQAQVPFAELSDKFGSTPMIYMG